MLVQEPTLYSNQWQNLAKKHASDRAHGGCNARANTKHQNSQTEPQHANQAISAVITAATVSTQTDESVSLRHIMICAEVSAAEIQLRETGLPRSNLEVSASISSSMRNASECHNLVRSCSHEKRGLWGAELKLTKFENLGSRSAADSLTHVSCYANVCSLSQN